MDKIAAKLEDCFRTVFRGLSSEDIRQASTLTMADWDSLSHVTLLTVIGETFDLDIDYEGFADADSYALISERLRKRVRDA